MSAFSIRGLLMSSTPFPKNNEAGLGKTMDSTSLLSVVYSVSNFCIREVRLIHKEGMDELLLIK